MATILNGRELSQEMRALTARQSKEFEKKYGHKVCLNIVQVGNDPSADSHVKSTMKAFEGAGLSTKLHSFDENVSQDEVLALISRLNDDKTVSGIIVEMPLPEQIDANAVALAISPKKDVEGFNPLSAGNLYLGYPAFAPSTPSGALELIKATGKSIVGKKAVVIGRSNIVGKPMAILLLQEGATVTICNSKTTNIAKVCSKADILVSAVGRAEFVTGDFIKEGATVIDVGINFKDGKLCGDVIFEEAEKKAAFISPVPGGSGPMTLAVLMQNTYNAAVLGEK